MSRSSDVANIGSFRALDAWVKVLGEQVKGSITPGYKAERVTFSGGTASSISLGTRGMAHRAETNLNVARYIDYSQGDIVSSHVDTHYAVKGAGMFAVARTLEAGESVHFTRNGEFHKDEDGYYRDAQGNYLLSADDIDPQGLVVRDPARFGRPIPDPGFPAGPPGSAVFAPGGVGVTDENFNGPTAEGYWIDPMTGGGGVVVTNNVTNFEAVAVGVGAPSAGQWRTNVTYAGQNDTALGGPNMAGQTIRWDSKAGAGNGGRGLYYGSQTAGQWHYQTGVEAVQTVDYAINYSSTPVWHDVDIRVVEADGSVVTYNNHYDNGFLNRDNQNGLRPGGAALADWDEYYTLQTQRAVDPGTGTSYSFVYDDYTYANPSYSGAVATGAYQLQAREYSGINTTVDWIIVEDAGTFRESVQTGTTALGPNATATIATKANVDRSHRAEVTSPEYNITGIEEGWVSWDQKSLVEDLANVDQMTFQYRYDSGAWSAPIDAKTLVPNDGNWHAVADIVLSGFAGHSTVQFKWTFDTVDSKENDSFGWAIDNFDFTTRDYTGVSRVTVDVHDYDGAIQDGDMLQLVDANGIVHASQNLLAGIPLGTQINLNVQDNAPPQASKWPFTNASIRLVRPDAVDPTQFTVIDDHTFATMPIDGDTELHLSMRRGFEAALFTDMRQDLQTSNQGIGYYDGTAFDEIPVFEPWGSARAGTGVAGSLVRSALEGANAKPQKIAEELVMAQRMYEGLTRLIQAHKDVTLSLIDAIR